MGISVKLEAFEGPLDLLLHLIEKNKIDIYDIPIAEITEQYMEYIGEIDTEDMDSASEFLVMAAELLRIKSKMLLPKERTEETEAEDPRQELVERLLEYKMYRYMSLELKDKQTDAARVLFRQQDIPDEIRQYKEEVRPEELLSGLTLAKLHLIFRTVIKKQTDKIDPVRSKFGRIEKEEVSLSDTVEEIEKLGREQGIFSFRSFIGSKHGKMQVIVAFLAVLELIKTGRITIFQDRLFDDIRMVYQTQEKTMQEEGLTLTEY